MRLEQTDSYLVRFDAVVTAMRVDSGNTWLALDRSAFYPSSGGQPHDTGQLDGAEVVDVIVEDGQVWHRIVGAVPAVGASVVGHIDWDRRYRHMQRHSAQHMLSQAFVRVDPAFTTRSVGLRSPDCTLDLGGDPSAGDLASAQAMVNDFGYQNLAITAVEVDEASLAAYPLRRPPKVHGQVRLVQMGDVEVAACGGTHLSHTAEALPIVLLDSHTIRGGSVRVTFRAGWDALDYLTHAHATVRTLVGALSAPLDELFPRVQQLQAELASAHAEADRVRLARATDLANALLERAAAGGQGAPAVSQGAAAAGQGAAVTTSAVTRASPRFVRALIDDELLDEVADVCQQFPHAIALLASRTQHRARLAFVRGTALDVDMRPALQAAVSELRGRGGGRPERAQGAGPAVDRAEAALDAAENEIAAFVAR